MALICAWEWYPNKKGLVTGLTLGGYGFGSFIFAQISTKLVNPNSDNPSIYDEKNDVTYFDQSVADRVPFMIRTLVFIWIFLVAIGIVFMSRKPKESESETEEREHMLETRENEIETQS